MPKGISYQPGQFPAYSAPAPQYTSYQPNQDLISTQPCQLELATLNTAPEQQSVYYQPSTSYSDYYSSYQPMMGSNVDLAQQFTN